MKTGKRPVIRTLSCSIVAVLLGASGASTAELPREVRLTGEPSPTVHYYRSTTEVVEIAPDGKRRPRDVYDLWLEYAPKPGAAGDLVTCRRFTVAQAGGAPVALPSLEGWSYTVHPGVDEHGFIFGIDQARFERLTDANGVALPLPVAYAAFNAFVDFHGFANVFARRTSEGGGIQDLRRFGQTVLHASAHSRPPIALGSTVAKGSTFQNGAITLELKGLTRIGGRRSALIGYDSGESSLKMSLTPMPGVTMTVVGGSRYVGDLYLDLETQWLLKATLIEMVVSETSGDMLPQKLASVTERHLLLQALRKSDFDASCQAGAR